MIGSFISRGLVMVFGYAYPAYECFKTVEKNKPEIEELIFWCQYWILVALLTVCEKICDAFISWVPMYSEAKLAFYIYLWFPKTKGTTYVYDSFFRPYVAKHETEIDRNLLELRTRAGDIVVLYCQKAATYGQAQIFDILQYIASHSTPKPQPAQPQRPVARSRQNSGPVNRKPAVTALPQIEVPSSPSSSASSSEGQNEVEDVVSPSQAHPTNPVGPVSNTPKTTVVQPPPPTAVSDSQKTITEQQKQPSPDPTKQSTATEAVAMQILKPTPSGNENGKPPPPENIVEEAIRVTRGRLRARTATATKR